MTVWFNAEEKNFAAQFDRFLRARRLDEDVRAETRAIITETRQKGDAALAQQAARFDGMDITADALRLDGDQIRQQASACPKELASSLDYAIDRIEAWHKRQMPQPISFRDKAGVEIEQRWRPVDSVGIYIPGGSARYPSSVLMSALPAKIAGVKRIAAATPANSADDPFLMMALWRLGITELWRMGGAGAIAAFAYGTERIAKVDKIVGPGNAYVAEAKRQVFGDVGIDMIAGPSEILVIADNQNDPAWVAADLLSQAEHDEAAQCLLITDDAQWARETASAIEAQLARLPREKIARASWTRYGAIIIVKDLEDSVAIANIIAAEHVELLVAQPKALADRIDHAGTIFIGAHTPEVIGDYVIGTNHVLPTSGAARFSSGLSVYDFMKRSAIAHCPESSFGELAAHAEMLAKAEGLDAHAQAASIRKTS